MDDANVAPRLFSFFSGAGFLDLGFEDAGFTVVLVNEKHKPFLDAYQYGRACLGKPALEYGAASDDVVNLLSGKPEVKLHEQVKQQRRRGDLVGFIGGPPCPDFSTGGRNRGGDGEHGRLSAIYIEMICEQQPDFFVFENVEGLFRVQKHRVFYQRLKRRLHECGYVTTDRVINCLEYRVLQHRRRIILTGFRKKLIAGRGMVEELTGELVPGVFPWRKGLHLSIDKVMALPWPKVDLFSPDSERPCPAGIQPELTVEHWFRRNHVYEHPNSEHVFKAKAGLARFQATAEGDVAGKSYKRLHRWRFSPSAAYGHNEVHLHPYKVRRISVAEALAIQSLPRKFALPPELTLSDMFKTIGNGVPYLAARGIAHALKDFLATLG